MLTPTLVLEVIAATAVVALACVRRIPEGHAYTLRRLGGHLRTVGAGIHVVVPLLERVAHRIRLLGNVVTVDHLTPAPAGDKGNPNPGLGILPPGSDAYGATYAEWNARFWQWAILQPTAHHPLYDTAPYDAGRRGAAWVKVKPRHTLDLVVLAVERGSGRRRGSLSNIHLGARDPRGGFVMLGKTFKGMTDEMLAWQTARFRELEVSDDGWTVTLRPEQVVEIAFDGLQRSTRYPGGLALRFARVIRYRDDKTAAEADTIETVRALLA